MDSNDNSFFSEPHGWGTPSFRLQRPDDPQENNDPPNPVIPTVLNGNTKSGQFTVEGLFTMPPGKIIKLL